MNLNPHHSAAPRTEKLRRSRQCGKCRGCDVGCAGLGYRVLSWVPAHGESGIHAAVRVKLTEKNQALAPLQIRLVIR